MEICVTGKLEAKERTFQQSRWGRPLQIAPSSPGEFHPEALTDPCLTVSSHAARATQ